MRGRKKKAVDTSPVPREGEVGWLVVVGARQNNLRDINVEIPLGRFVCVTGVSGSGKSSLVNDIIRETLARDLNGATKVDPGDHDHIEGLEHLDKVIDIDQSPIGRTPRSNPATYIKVFDEIRALYAKLPDSRVRGYKPGRFSFNVPTGKAGGGRCEACEGNGSNKMEMDFLADVWVTCPVCAGRRFSRETLQTRYKGKSIADVLDMDVPQALEHFEPVPKIAAMLRTLHDVGLDYMKLGQSSTTLSGGEAQRIKLARELVKKSTGRTLYLLDEPTTGLHFDDIKKLLAVLHSFVDAGNSVIVIEHNLDVIKTADWVIDLGPEGGDAGGRIVATGPPEQVARSKRSYTGQALRDVLHPETSKRRNVKTSILGSSFSRKPEGQRARADLGRDIGVSSGTSKRRNGREDVITVLGAKQHNLKDINVEVPRGKMSVCCGPSGSGKTTFAIDTLYTEGQRRYVESLSAYARQFLSRLQPPRVDHVYGLSPAVCIEQKTASKSPRSTVGTITEIYDYMRVLWVRVGQPFCPVCQVPIGTQSSEEIVEKILALGESQRVILLAPIEPMGPESYEELIRRERANGYTRVRVDGIVQSLDELVDIDRKRTHQVELVVDRVVIRESQASRLTDSVEQALAVGDGVMIVQLVADERADRAADFSPRGDGCDDRAADFSPRGINGAGAPGATRDAPRKLKPTAQSGEYRFSQHHSCDQCGRSYDELTPHHFSFNTRLGWCKTCEGLGIQKGASPAAIVIHPTRSIADGAIAGWGELKSGSKLQALALALADHIGFDLHRPWNQLTESQRLMFLH
ncbi:MAG: ATP-binding cassette domain-containing protein, partial [Planctomycetes bacterium]|nr:ATP-binding cassette domain-containing protein [Planctomycetota bacterium]